MINWAYRLGGSCFERRRLVSTGLKYLVFLFGVRETKVGGEVKEDDGETSSGGSVALETVTRWRAG